MLIQPKGTIYNLNCGGGLTLSQARKLAELLNLVRSTSVELSQVSLDVQKLREDVEVMGANASHPLAQNVEGIINVAPNQGSQTVNDNRQYAAAIPPPNVIGGMVTALAALPTMPILPNESGSSYFMRRNMYVESHSFREAGHENSAFNPGSEVTFSLDRPFPFAVLIIGCDKACELTWLSLPTNERIGHPRAADREIRNANVISFDTPLPIPGNTPITIRVRSETSEPVTILSVVPWVPQR